MITSSYLWPVAQHRDAPERLVLRDDSGTWFLWFGDGSDLVGMPEALVIWILARPETVMLGEDVMWFELSSLPVGSGNS
ncbi:MAG: hypothetical protein AVDCRST_MAG87-3144 [uncultured Thermomicrobiales bacterium]|uniref:Uncharacterized protein n=1 Tax=uncultured Thermomicrobiales bacterium TaxID=1645740 RepID=A0A6J4VGT1_9BACT|nr:MAG: hypothetical protein AVDCRST_MAG87-3144 [uncultured Thermomicrobiales bacterium]